MAGTALSGPDIVYGNMLAAGVGSAAIPDNNEVAGPSVTFQGDCLPDVRYNFNKDNVTPGSIPGFINHPYTLLVDAQPQTLSNTAITAAGPVTAATPMTLVTTATKAILAGTPLVPFGAAATVSVLTIDPGFQTVNITSGSPTVTIAAGTATNFPIGTWFYFGASATAGFYARVTANTMLSTTTTITISQNAAATNANCPVLTTNLVNPFMQTANQVPTSVWPYVVGGAVAAFDPTQAVTRAVSITGNAGSTAQNFTVRGYDIYGFAMTEVIAFAGGAATTPGKKAFKYIASVTPASTDAGHNLSVGTTDVIGMNLRNDKWEYDNFFYNGAFVTVSTGWLAADQAVATGTTGDTRGTYALQSASDGTKRVAFFTTIPVYNLINATPTNPAAMFGATQFSG